MIRILKKRNKIKCKVCKSKLTFEAEDVLDKCTRYLEVPWEDYTYYIICPVCKARVVIGEITVY